MGSSPSSGSVFMLPSFNGRTPSLYLGNEGSTPSGSSSENADRITSANCSSCRTLVSLFLVPQSVGTTENLQSFRFRVRFLTGLFLGAWCSGNISDSKSEDAGPIPAAPVNTIFVMEDHASQQ